MNFIEFGILRYALHCSNCFGARLENPKINEQGGPNNSEGDGEGGGSELFQKKNKPGDPFIRDLRVATAIKNESSHKEFFFSIIDL